MAELTWSIKDFLSSLFKLTRFGNVVIIALAQYFTAGYLVGVQMLDDSRLFFLSVSTAIRN